MPALGEGLGACSDVSTDRLTEPGVEGALPRLIEPKPLNSGISPGWDALFWAMLSAMLRLGGVDGGAGDPKAARVLLGVLTLSFVWRAGVGVSGCCCFWGEMDFARS